MLVGQAVAADEEAGDAGRGDGLAGVKTCYSFCLRGWKRYLDGVLAESIADHLNVVNVDNIN